ncbi:uncharacterized protein LOC111638362 isoform X2 [Centruroides sculpturatus]|uniref:uncharacterized protein LOC111638359 isoform X2 n=1 Tax=Centruroides sculpturatus TaxID=218467 RepID=UPI000C6ED37F|nr:uncharacterized protein LOC111638359 isoform X2 [Centruroides sculpturatus]XP_023239832.1 uncharacterized protein LOC111638362 isoform X2 [Centruroides sculpturatus]
MSHWEQGKVNTSAFNLKIFKMIDLTENKGNKQENQYLKSESQIYDSDEQPDFSHRIIENIIKKIKNYKKLSYKAIIFLRVLECCQGHWN